MNGKPGKYSFTSKTRRLHDKDRFTGRIHVGASCTKIKKSSSFYFRWKDLPFQSDAFQPELCTKNIYQTVQTISQTAEVSRNALDNIFGRYTSNCSNSRSVPSSGEILNETTSRSGILSEHEQVSSYSHPKNNFSGFSYRLCKYDNFSPRGKQLAIIQKANSLLGQNLVSIRNLCQFVGMCSATCPALRQAPLFHRKIQLSINKVLSKAGLNKKRCYNQKIRLNFQVHQNLQWWAEEMPHHCKAPVFSPPVDVKIATNSSFLGWGATMGHARIASLKEWERLWSHINKKELQTCFNALEHFVSHLRDIHVQLSVDNTAAVSYLNHAGGTRSQALSDLAIAIWEWCLQRRINLSGIYIPGIVNKTPDGLSRQKLESTERMLDSSVFVR